MYVCIRIPIYLQLCSSSATSKSYDMSCECSLLHFTRFLFPMAYHHNHTAKQALEQYLPAEEINMGKEMLDFAQSKVTYRKRNPRRRVSSRVAEAWDCLLLPASCKLGFKLLCEVWWVQACSYAVDEMSGRTYKCLSRILLSTCILYFCAV